jgi:hypothetical protein
MHRLMRRRRFLKLSLFSTVSLGAVGVLGTLGASFFGWGSGGSDLVGPGGAALSAQLRCLSIGDMAILRAALLRILDGAEPPVSNSATGRADGAVQQCLFADRYLAGLAAPIRSDFRALLGLLQHWPLVSGYRSRFTHLSTAEQDRVLSTWQRSRWDLLRQGFHGLKALCCFAHYQDARSFPSIGYSGPLVPKNQSPDL